MAKNVRQIPERFRKIVEPILMKDEKIICTFQESFRLDEFFFPKWLVLTNLRLIILAREIPGIRMEEYHLAGMTIEIFVDDIGIYNSVEFLVGGESVYQLAVYHKRWEEAKEFVSEVSKSIEQLNFELRSEVGSDQENNPEGQKDQEGVKKPGDPESQKICSNSKRHLQDLRRMGAITEEEYQEEKEKPCENE